MSDFRVIDHTGEVKSKVAERVIVALGLMGEVVEGYAKEDCPVDTGRLRNSLTHQEAKDACHVGSDVEYAPAVEFRDMAHRVGKAHFLRDAGQNHIDEIRDAAQSAFMGL